MSCGRGKPLELLLFYQFKDDREAHDDELQHRIEVEFEKEWKKATTEVAREFGAATVAVDYHDTAYVPLNGVGCVSSGQLATGGCTSAARMRTGRFCICYLSA